MKETKKGNKKEYAQLIMTTLASRNMQLFLTFKNKVLLRRCMLYYFCGFVNASGINHPKNVRSLCPGVPVTYSTVVIICTTFLNIIRLLIFCLCVCGYSYNKQLLQTYIFLTGCSCNGNVF